MTKEKIMVAVSIYSKVRPLFFIGINTEGHPYDWFRGCPSIVKDTS